LHLPYTCVCYDCETSACGARLEHHLAPSFNNRVAPRRACSARLDVYKVAAAVPAA
jgi:hypothetical protein